MAESRISPQEPITTTRGARWSMLAFLGLALLGGAIIGLVWALTAPLPGYVVNDDLSATMSERGLAGVFSADIAFAGWTALLGLAIGLLAWWRFQRYGWLVAAIALLGSGLAAIVAWRVGILISPEDFSQRLTNAHAGDTVAIDLALRAKSALLVAPFLAITPTMLLSAFLPDPDEESVAPTPPLPLTEVTVPAPAGASVADGAAEQPVAAD